MWTLGILLLIAMFTSANRVSRCRAIIPLVRDPHCGFASNCNTNAINKWVIAFESCRRKELNVSDFKKVLRGMCPKGDKPPCSQIPKA
ncbi:accessory gland protein Acp63F-like [Drosophila ananassae]|uniref:accessory gland protein Acp63F-like n=1 Tax=Drosophila ananassae TaxID=7217 RepID=UPI0013A5DC55|nr:accessory gland protein Acp63F-like [Drosophila ananassae]